MNYLNYEEEYLKRYGGYQTAMEISRQPDVWLKTFRKLHEESKSIDKFLRNAFKEVDNIVLTGAGSSSFIGNSVADIMYAQLNIITRVIPTTHIVTFPELYFNPSRSTLIISFARSGDSPESIASLELADRYSKKCFHLIITCNESGELAHFQSKNPSMVFVLPEEANDEGLAMTCSYTSMLMTALFITFLNEREIFNEQFELSINVAQKLLSDQLTNLETIAKKNFTRAVFLGSGPLFGTAMEASLKLQELTNGRVICKADSFLGFRHGPKVIVNEDTLVVYFFSNNKYASQYEIDLVNSMQHALYQIGIGEKVINEIQIDKQIILSSGSKPIHKYFQSLSYIIPGQLIGFFKSMQLGIKPDTPSLNGAISRVVQGVNIYPIET
ncbi:MAG: SIS domain-containing protein [Acidobacterium ailaaui]|nr:SIS domain-containing protein [Pseudacidobacterium ailaaui]